MKGRSEIIFQTRLVHNPRTPRWQSTVVQVPHEPDRRSAPCFGWRYGGTISKFAHHQVGTIQSISACVVMLFFSGSTTTSSTSPMEYSERRWRNSNRTETAFPAYNGMVQHADCDKVVSPSSCPNMSPYCQIKENGDTLKYKNRGHWLVNFYNQWFLSYIYRIEFPVPLVTNIFAIRQWMTLLDLLII